MSFRRHPDRNIVITGFYGCPVREIGRELARRLRRPFLDVPTEIERRMRHNLLIRAGINKAPSRELMAEWVVRDLSYRRSTVAILNGDSIAHPDSFDELHVFSYVVYLDPPFDVLWERIQRDASLNDKLLELGHEGLRDLWLEQRRNVSFCNLQLLLPVDDTSYVCKIIAHCFYT